MTMNYICKVEMRFRQCDGGDFVGCRGSSLRLTHAQVPVPPEEAAFTSDSTVVLGAPFGWSHGILTCKACKRDVCAKAVTTFLVGDQPGSVIHSCASNYEELDMVA